MNIRVMKIEDFDQVHALWMSIKGFGIRSVDDSREGVERFLKRNPTTSVVAEEDGKIVGKGTHEELMKNCSAYQEIARSQLSESELKGGMAE